MTRKPSLPAPPEAAGAELALVKGRVWTGDPGRPWAEAVAVAGGKILSVGTTAEVRKLLVRGTDVVDLGGSLVLPGFTDCHTHFLAGGFALKGLDLREARGRAEFAAAVAAKARELGRGRWILDGGWDEQRFLPPGLPHREWIDLVTPDNPVCVSRLDLHTVLANSLAMKIAGITRETPAPAGGEIVRDPATGDPTGVLKDAAADLVTAKIPPPSFADRVEAAEAALRHAAENGVTSVHDMADEASFEVYRELLRRDRLTARLSVYLPITERETLVRLRRESPSAGPRLRPAGLKGFVDGSLGSATACFFEPYADDPSWAGILHSHMFPDGAMEERIMAADRAGLQLAIHAIGDRANSLLLDMIERTVAANGPRDRRWRVEHAQHLRPGDIARFGRLGLVASVQPYHLVDDGCWADAKIGPARAQTTFAFGSLRRAGATLAFGSDWTVAPMSPVLGIHAAVTRRTLDGRNPDGWSPGERVPVEDAVRASTLNGAYVEFAEAVRGMVKAGMLADLVVLDRDIFAIASEEIGGARVRMTVADGKIVYRAEGRP